MPPASKSIRAMLAGTDRRSKGAADEVARLIVRAPGQFAEAVAAMSDGDAVVRMRASDAVEKASRAHRELLAPHKAVLLGSLAACAQQEVRWHVLMLLARLALSPAERARAWALALASLDHPSRIVVCEALSALHALSATDAALARRYRALAKEYERSGPPSVRARIRRLSGKSPPIRNKSSRG